MNPKGFPKRLDSKTGCLRITVPENLDLALEGLIRKVLREQPKTDDIYAFAAEYFETLLRIRDRAGVEYTTPQLCPFHNDEETREMIVLAGTFPKHLPAKVQGKGSAPLKTETEKEADRAEHEKGVKIPKRILKDSNSEAETKQATPDLIKKLPLLAPNKGLNGEKTTDLGPDREKTETVAGGGDEEEYSTSDPIKEFVEKELSSEGKSKEKVAEGETPEPSESGSQSLMTREAENEAEGGAPPVRNADEKKDADEGDNPGAADNVDGVIRAGEEEGERKIDPGTRETDEKGVEARDAEGKIGSASQAEAEGERPLQEKQQKKEKEESEEEIGKRGAEEETENKKESAPETEVEAEGVEAPLPPLPPSPGGAEKNAEEVGEVPASSSSTVADVSNAPEGRKATQTQSAASSEAASPKERGIEEVGGVQEPAEGKNETDAQPSTASPTKTDEESPENGARGAETDKSQKSDKKEAIDNSAESTAGSEGEAQDKSKEAASGRTEGRINGTETVSSPERAKGVQEVEESGATLEEEGLHQTKGGELSKNLDTEAEDLSTPDLQPTEGAKGTSASAVEAEGASEEPQTDAEDATVKPGDEGTESSGKLDPGPKSASEILKPDQFPNSHVTGSEPIRGDEEGKESVDKKLSDEAKAEDQSLAERPGNQTSPEEELPFQKAEDVPCTVEAPTEKSTTEGTKSEEHGGAKQEAPRDASSPTEPDITGRETESAKFQEFKAEDAPTAENESTSPPVEELCSVVDINHLKRDGGNQEEPTGPLPENTGQEGSPSLSPGVPNGETSREDQNGSNFQREPEPEGAMQGKAESDKVDSSEGTPTRDGFDPSTRGKQIIIVEEPEPTDENAEESPPPGEIQIKTIQTHYYDALRVPETLTREYRVHEMIVPTIDGVPGDATPPPDDTPTDEHRLTEDDGVPPAPKTSPASDADVSSYAEAQSYVGHHGISGSLLAVDGDAPGSDSDDLLRPPSPSSDVHLGFQAASETFLINEKRFSSLDKEETRFVTPPTEEPGKCEPEGQEEEGDGTALPSTAGGRAGTQTPEKTEESTEGMEVPEKERPLGAAAVGGRRDFPPPSENPVSEPRGESEYETALDAPRLPSGIRSDQEDSRLRMVGGEGATESLHLKTQENVPEEVRAGSPSTERTPTDSTTSSATTEVKRADSASARSLSSAHSLDLGKRNPLLRTRSLSTHRHGVADFEVWTTIEKELEEAATKIQSKFRGYAARKKLRREVAVQISTEESSERSTPVEADDADCPRATGEFHDVIVLDDHPR